MLLEQNYRSTKRILSIAAAVIANNTGRARTSGCGPRTPRASARALPRVGRARGGGLRGRRRSARPTRDGADYRDIAVFYRTNAQSRVLEDALRRASIPYVIVGGVRFYERREIKDVVAYLRLVVNPLDDVAFRRAVGAPARGIGKTTLERLAEVARVPGRSMLAAVPGRCRRTSAAKPRRALEDVRAADRAPGRARGPELALPAFIDEVLVAPATARR